MPVSVASIVETLAPVAAGTARAMSHPGPGREFAALVRAMIGARNAGRGTDGAVATIAAPTAATGGDEADELAASLAGSLVATQMAAPALAPSAIPTEADAPTTGIGASAPAPEGALANGAIGAAQPLPPTEAGDAGKPAEPGATPPPEELPLPAAQPLPPGNWAGHTDAADLPPWLRDIPDSDLLRSIAEEALQSATGTNDGAEPTGGHGKHAVEPPATPESVVSMDSVVRFAGNAERSTTGDGRGGHTAGQPLAAIAAAATPAAGVADAASAAVATPSVPVADTTVDLPPAVQRVEQAVIDRVEQGGGEAHIRLDPPELGSVHIRVRIDGDHVQLHVEADRQAAASLLRNHTADLSSLLGDRGLNLADVYVGLGGGGSAGDARDETPQQRGRGRANDGEFAAILGIDTAPATSTHNRLRSAYNPDGAHSYRV